MMRYGQAREWRVGRLALVCGKPYTHNVWPHVHTWPREGILLAVYWRTMFASVCWVPRETAGDAPRGETSA